MYYTFAASKGIHSSKFWSLLLFLLVLHPQQPEEDNYLLSQQNLPLKTSSTSFHPGKETNLRSLHREQCQKGILHAWMNICPYILVNISMKIQREDAFSGQSHSDDRPMITHCHCYVSSLLHKHKEGKAQPTNVQQSFLLLLSSNHHL